MLKSMYPASVNSLRTELVSGISATQTTITLVDASVVPDAPNLLTIGGGENAETVRYGGKTGNQLTDVTRGFQGMAASWSAGTDAARYFTAYDADAVRENIASVSTDLEQVDVQLVAIKEQKANKEDVAKISNGTPLFANTISEMVDTTRAYVLLTDGYIYLYNSSNSTFERTNKLYQSTGLADKSVTPEIVTFIKTSTNLFDKSEVKRGYAIQKETGELYENASYCVLEKNEIEPNKVFTIYTNLAGRVAFYDASGAFISSTNILSTVGKVTLTTPSNTKTYSLQTAITQLDITQVNKGETLLPYEPFYKPYLKGVEVHSIVEDPKPSGLVYTNGQLTSVTEEGVETTTMQYNSSGQLISITDKIKGVKYTLSYTDGILSSVTPSKI